MALTADTLVSAGVPREKAERYLPLLTAGMREFGITTQQRASFYIAQLLEESIAFTAMEELASGAEYEGRVDLGNIRRGDGVRYKGRGPIQLTGRGNYRFYGHKLGLDLEGHPRLAARPRVGFRTAAMFFHDKGCNELADRGDFIGVTKRINGGTRGLDERQRYLRLLKGHDCTPGRPGIVRGDRGDAVVVMTRRLSYVHSPKNDAPYLDGARRRFDREAQIALKRFQRDHGIEPTGIFDPRTQNALARRVAARKKRRRRQDRAAPPVTTMAHAVNGKASAKHTTRRPPPRRPRSTAELLARLDHVDAVRSRLLARLVHRGARLERMLAPPPGPGPVDLHSLGEELARLEAMIESVRASIASAEGDAHAPAATGRAPS